MVGKKSNDGVMFGGGEIGKYFINVLIGRIK